VPGHRDTSVALSFQVNVQKTCRRLRLQEATVLSAIQHGSDLGAFRLLAL
jgi:hypothetical protein